MIPKKAIEKAIEGGWAKSEFPIEEIKVFGSVAIVTRRMSAHSTVDTRAVLSDVALDASFWESLGKALGWPEKEVLYDIDPWDGSTHIHEQPRYIINAHRLIQLAWQGGDINSFWDGLLK